MNKFCGRDAHRADNGGGVAQGLRGHPILAIAAVQITAEHTEAVRQCSWMSMEEGFFLYRVALDAANIAPGHKQRSAAVVANLANPGLAFWDLATVPAGETPHPVAVELFVQFALANVFMNDFVQCTHLCQGQCQRNVSYLLFDICRAEIYRRQRNSCCSRCTLATSRADLPARRWPSPDRPEHRHRSQCTQWDRYRGEALHRTSGVHRHRRGLSPDGYNPPGTHLHRKCLSSRDRARQ